MSRFRSWQRRRVGRGRTWASTLPSGEGVLPATGTSRPGRLTGVRAGNAPRNCCRGHEGSLAVRTGCKDTAELYPAWRPGIDMLLEFPSVNLVKQRTRSSGSLGRPGPRDVLHGAFAPCSSGLRAQCLTCYAKRTACLRHQPTDGFGTRFSCGLAIRSSCNSRSGRCCRLSALGFPPVFRCGLSLMQPTPDRIWPGVQ